MSRAHFPFDAFFLVILRKKTAVVIDRSLVLGYNIGGLSRRF